MVGGQPLVPVERIEKAILQIRGQRVRLDADLSTLYGVEKLASSSGLSSATLSGFRRSPNDVVRGF